MLPIIYMLYEYVGICPSSGNSTNDLHLTATALAQHAHQKYNVKSQGGRVRWRGEAKQTVWNSTCQPISVNVSQCDMAGSHVCYNYWPNSRKFRKLVCFNKRYNFMGSIPNHTYQSFSTHWQTSNKETLLLQ